MDEERRGETGGYASVAITHQTKLIQTNTKQQNSRGWVGQEGGRGRVRGKSTSKQRAHTAPPTGGSINQNQSHQIPFDTEIALSPRKLFHVFICVCLCVCVKDLMCVPAYR